MRSSNEELIAVLNSSHRRSGAYVWRVEEIARQRVPTRFSTWGAVTFAGIRELPETLQDRSIVVRLQKALPGEVKAHLSDGTSSALTTIKAKFAHWASDLRHLPEPKLPPGLHNRLGDNWRPLLALADLAGGRWPRLIRTAALSSAINDIEPEAVTKEQRAAAKPVNFGSIYGMSAKGLSAAAWSSYGVDLPEADAKLALDRFFDKYSGLRKWMREHSDRCERARKVVIGAGRVVENAWETYPLGFPQMCNLPVQGVCADCMMRAIAYVHAERAGILVAMVHDELLAEVPESDADGAVETLKACLHRAFVETFPGAPTLGLVDAHVGASWADLK